MMFDGYGDGYGMSMSGMWGFWLFGLLLLVGIGVLIFFAVRAGGGFGRGPGSGTSNDAASQTPRRDNPREVLDHRYARGELETEEYRERVRTLSDGP